MNRKIMKEIPIENGKKKKECEKIIEYFHFDNLNSFEIAYTLLNIHIPITRINRLNTHFFILTTPYY